MHLKKVFCNTKGRMLFAQAVQKSGGRLLLTCTLPGAALSAIVLLAYACYATNSSEFDGLYKALKTHPGIRLPSPHLIDMVHLFTSGRHLWLSLQD